jgi:transcriptional regulator with XRE-family HTH domain
MNIKSLRAALRKANLSELARRTKLHLRTLRRIKSGETQNPSVLTVEAIERGLK